MARVEIEIVRRRETVETVRLNEGERVKLKPNLVVYPNGIAVEDGVRKKNMVSGLLFPPYLPEVQIRIKGEYVKMDTTQWGDCFFIRRTDGGSVKK